MSKGHRQRPASVDRAAYEAAWERTFGVKLLDAEGRYLAQKKATKLLDAIDCTHPPEPDHDHSSR